MSLTYTEAYDQILDLFKTAWDTTGFKAFYEDLRDQRDASESPYVTVFSGGVVSSQSTLYGSVGNRRFKRDSFITILLFTPSGKGLQQRNNLVKVITDAFEGVSIANGVWVRNIRIDGPVRDGKFSQTNITVEFTYDEIK